MTVVWSIYDHTGAAYNLKGKEVRLYYTCERGRFEVDFEVQGTNIVVWSFLGREQKVIGDYTLSLEIIESADRRRIFKDYCNAFTLVGKSCEEAALGNPNISEDGNIVLSSKLDVYKIQPIIPTVGSNSNWFVDGTDTGKPSTGKSAYEYAKEKGYEGTESEYAESLKLAPENAEKLTELDQEWNAIKNADFTLNPNIEKVVLTESEVTLEPGKYYTWETPMAYLDISLIPPTQQNYVGKYIFSFTCPLNAPTYLNLHVGLVWNGVPDFKAGDTYLVFIYDNIAIFFADPKVETDFVTAEQVQAMIDATIVSSLNTPV